MKNNSLGILMIIGSFFFALIICNRNISNAVGSVSQTTISDTSVLYNFKPTNTLNSIPFDTIMSSNPDGLYSQQYSTDTSFQLGSDTTYISYDTSKVNEDRKTIEEIQAEYEMSSNLRKDELALNELKSKQFLDSVFQEQARKTNIYLNELEIEQLKQQKLDQLNGGHQTYYNTYGTNPNVYGTNPNVIEVNGFSKSNGTYVSPYHRTAPNNTIRDNFSTYPNVNPYTGRTGTRYH